MDMGHEMEHEKLWMMNMAHKMDHKYWALFKEFKLAHLFIIWIRY